MRHRWRPWIAVHSSFRRKKELVKQLRPTERSHIFPGQQPQEHVSFWSHKINIGAYTPIVKRVDTRCTRDRFAAMAEGSVDFHGLKADGKNRSAILKTIQSPKTDDLPRSIKQYRVGNQVKTVMGSEQLTLGRIFQGRLHSILIKLINRNNRSKARPMKHRVIILLRSQAIGAVLVTNKRHVARSRRILICKYHRCFRNHADRKSTRLYSSHTVMSYA